MCQKGAEARENSAADENGRTIVMSDNEVNRHAGSVNPKFEMSPKCATLHHTLENACAAGFCEVR